MGRMTQATVISRTPTPTMTQSRKNLCLTHWEGLLEVADHNAPHKQAWCRTALMLSCLGEGPLPVALKFLKPRMVGGLLLTPLPSSSGTLMEAVPMLPLNLDF